VRIQPSASVQQSARTVELLYEVINVATHDTRFGRPAKDLRYHEVAKYPVENSLLL
jgi:hypothetical protein